MADRLSPQKKSPRSSRINPSGLQPDGDRLDAPFRENVNRKTHRRRPCPGSPNLKAAREKQPRQKPRSPIALRDFQRASGTGKLCAHYSNGPFWKTQLPTVLPHSSRWIWKTQLPTVLPHSSRWMPGPFHMHRSPGAIHSNQTQETIVPASLKRNSLNAPRKEKDLRKDEGTFREGVRLGSRLPESGS